MSVTEKYLQIVLKYYIAQYPNQEYERKLIKGLWGYSMPCPFCSLMCDSEFGMNRKVAYFVPQKDSFNWYFNCNRSRSPECRRSSSFPNFLAMLNPDLFRKYQKEAFNI